MRGFRGVCFSVLGVLAAASAQELRLAPVASGLRQPTDIQAAGDRSGRLFLAQQHGVIRVWKDGALLPVPFLDIQNRTVAGGERGLLGLAFPPGFEIKQYFYVNYTDLAGDTVIARYRVSADPNVADAASEEVLLHLDQPFANHNGGQLRFGPDAYLYIGMGDGGSANDPLNNAQNPQVLLGKMLRVDTESEPGRINIPPGNPFLNVPGHRPEIWALGLRNPWRFSFDRATGDLWIADVGQNRAEEVNFQPASSRGGENYGWAVTEGLGCLRAGCSAAGITLPVLDYGRSDGCSVSGGHVYRGRNSASLRGMYLYGDYCSGKIWGVRREADAWVNRLLLDSDLTISTFGEDENGEVYVADHPRGDVYRIQASSVPAFTAAGAVNAASYEPGLTPGAVATIFAAGLLESEGIITAPGLPLPLELNGVRVMVNGRAAAIYAVANAGGSEQVNFVVPPQTAGGAAASVVIVRDELDSTPVQVPVLPAQPGIFPAVVHHEENTLVTEDNPARSGEILYFYATGFSGPAQVTLGGVAVRVLYSGPAPGLPGIQQINIQAPAILAGGSADLVIIAEGATSHPASVPTLGQ